MSEDRDLPDYEETRRALEVFLSADRVRFREVSAESAQRWFSALAVTEVDDVAAYLRDVHRTYDVLPAEHAADLEAAARDALVPPDQLDRIRTTLVDALSRQTTPVGKDLVLLWNVEAPEVADDDAWLLWAAKVLLLALLGGGLVGATAHLPADEQVRAYLMFVLPVLVTEIRRQR